MGTGMLVCRGRRSCRCWRERLIWRAIEISTADLSTESDSSIEGLVTCVMTDCLALLASSDGAVDVDGEIICHCGSGMLGRKDGGGKVRCGSISVGESSMKLDCVMLNCGGGFGMAGRSSCADIVLLMGGFPAGGLN